MFKPLVVYRNYR